MLSWRPQRADEKGHAVSDKSNEKKPDNWIAGALYGAIVIAIVRAVWPDVIPFAPFSFWRWDHTFLQLLSVSWPVLAWGGGITLLFTLGRRRSPQADVDPQGILIGGFLISLWAGVMEELCFRWLLFLASIATVTFFNFLFFGWLGFGIIEHLMQWIFLPVADFFTLGKLHGLLFHPTGWAVGGAIIAANARFRNGHAYLGALGFVNSWFIGMYMFWLLFNYGLPAAMLVHFLYDMLIFGIRFLERVIKG